MDFILAIAMLCHTSAQDTTCLTKGNYSCTENRQVDCQQRYIHCVNTSKVDGTKQDKLERCILEKK